jgi:hypothetical protein
MMVKIYTLFFFIILFNLKTWAQPCLVKFSGLSIDTTISTCNYKEFNYNLTGGTPQSFKWFYGDGNWCTCNKVKNFYKKNDTFQLIGIVYDANGCSDSVFQDVIVKCDNPCDLSDIAIYSIDTLYYECNEVEFYANVSQSTKELTWDFGDGETSNNKFDVHLYAANGNFDSRLIIKDSIGCADTLDFSVEIDCDDIIEPEPCDFRITLLDTNFTSNCKEKRLTVEAIHLIKTIRWWTNDSGYFNGTTTQLIRYSDTGIFSTCVMITDSLGCKDSTCLDVRVNCPNLATSILNADFSLPLIYPNPVQNILNVIYTEPCQYFIINDLGQVVLSGKSITNNEIDVSILRKGVYQLKLKDKSQYLFNQLFIKN